MVHPSWIGRAAVFCAVAAGIAFLGPSMFRDRDACRVGGEDDANDALPSRSLYYEMRLYGNPDVDVMDRIWNENERALARERTDMQKSAASDVAWSSIGPVNISGRVRALAMHASRPGVVYAGAASGGVWRTTNSGGVWEPLTDDAPALAVGALAIDPKNPDVLYAGTGEPSMLGGNTHGVASIAYYGLGVLKSTDAGASWTKLAWPNSKSMIHRIAVHPDVTDTLLVASTSDLWKSSNGGQSWSRSLSGVVTDVAYRPGSGSVVYAAIGTDYGSSSNGVYISEAGGKNFSWRKLSTNFPRGDSTGRIILGVSPADPNRLYAAVALNLSIAYGSGNFRNDFLAFMISKDGGQTWERKSSAPRNLTNGQAYYDFAIAVSPTNADQVLVGGIDIYRTTNAGGGFSKMTDWSLRTSSPTSPRYVHADQHFILFDPSSPNTVYAACDGGVHMSTNSGVDWSTRCNGLATTQFYSCSIDSFTPYRAYGGTQDQSNQRQSGPGDNTWVFIGGGDGGSVAVDTKTTANIVFVVNGDPQRTLNSGQSSVPLTNGLNGGSSADRQFWWKEIVLHPQDRTLLFTGSQYVYRMSKPFDVSNPVWAVVSPDLGKGGGSSAVVSDMAFAPTNPEWMYAVTGNGKAWRCENIRSSDPQWTEISAGLPNRWLSRAFVDQDDNRTVYVAVSGFGGGHAYKSTDAGASWTDISGDLPDIPAGAIVRSQANPQMLFLATDIGVWYTMNGGVNWQRYGTGFPNTSAYDMKLAPDQALVVGSYGRGMWIASSILSAEPAVMPGRATLMPNYPNPVVSQAEIVFSLPKTGYARIALYDMGGRLVRVLSASEYAPGTQRILFDRAGLPGGIYFITLETAGERITRKMTIID